MRGYLYILSNNAMPNLFKIGFTTRTITERIRELSSTGVPVITHPQIWSADFGCFTPRC
jgi:hypothetical protein